MTTIEHRRVDENFVIRTCASNEPKELLQPEWKHRPISLTIETMNLRNRVLRLQGFVDCEESRKFGSHGGRCASVNGCLVGSKQRARHLRVLFGHMRGPLSCTLASAPDFIVSVWLAMVFGQFINGSGIFALTLACFCFSSCKLQMVRWVITINFMFTVSFSCPFTCGTKS